MNIKQLQAALEAALLDGLTPESEICVFSKKLTRWPVKNTGLVDREYIPGTGARKQEPKPLPSLFALYLQEDPL